MTNCIIIAVAGFVVTVLTANWLSMRHSGRLVDAMIMGQEKLGERLLAALEDRWREFDTRLRRIEPQNGV